MKFSLDEMAIFVWVAECGSFSSAARKSGMPVSTVSRRIADLETRLSVQLLHRTTRSQELTEIGRVYFEHCQRMLQEAEAAERAVESLQAEPTGRLTITTPYAYEDPFMSYLMSSFMQKYPKVRIQHIISAQKLDLVEQNIDCAILPGELQDSNLIRRGLGTVRIIYCASPRYVQRMGAPRNLEQVKGHDAVEMQVAPWLNPEPDATLDLVNIKMSTNDMSVARQSAKDGMGITRLPYVYVAQSIAKKELVEVLPELAIDIPINLVFPGNRLCSTKLRAFLDHIVSFSKLHATWNFS
ncbi:MAG: LysR family transcriptional regulator [Oleiphilaceae bacterium]|nr:LysR family transcriptional regulator [Oleiphilaceae bacterium]